MPNRYYLPISGRWALAYGSLELSGFLVLQSDANSVLFRFEQVVVTWVSETTGS